MNAFKLTKQAVIFTAVCVYLPTVEEIYDLNMIYYPNNSLYMCEDLYFLPLPSLPHILTCPVISHH